MATITENNGDAGADPAATSYSIALGDVFQGTLDSAGDTDLVQVELSADTIYDFGLSSPETLYIALVDADGNLVVDGALNTSGARIIISPPADGVYYIGIYGPSEGSGGDYEISFGENTIPVGTYDEIAAYLTEGYWDGYRYAFDVGPGGVLTADVTSLAQENQQLAIWALEAWTNVTGIRFELVGTGDADISFSRKEEGTSSGGFTVDGNGTSISGRVSFATGDSSSSIARKLYVLVHEIGHVLGLGHPGPYPRDHENPGAEFGIDNVFLLDSAQASAMSYLFQSENTYIDASFATPFTPMVADIIAVQDLYGVPADINSGDTVYGYDSNLDGYLGQVFAWWAGDSNPFAAVDGSAYGHPALADLDGDGDLDLVIGNNHLNSDGTGYDGYDVDYYENTGTLDKPVFTLRTGADNPLDGAESFVEFQPVLADLDGDADPDLLIGNRYYYENTGTAAAPAFTQRTGADNPLDGIRSEHYKRVVLPDLDADGDLDLVAVNGEGALLYFENTGTAAQSAFTQRSGAGNPFADTVIEKDEYGTGSPAFADLDADADPDLVIGTIDGEFDYYENTGTAMVPAYTQRTGADNPFDGLKSGRRLNPEFTDIDNDGDLDLVTGDSWGKVDVFENAGTDNRPYFSAESELRYLALTLYDNGGNDTLDLRNDTNDQRVSLRPEGISDVYGLTGNLVIARDTVIENFVAGSGNDIVTGNAAANYLQGNDGNDGLWGSGGDDILEGGAGADRINGDAGLDLVSYRGSDAAVTVNLADATVSGGHADGDVITGIEGAIGSDHDDVLQGTDAANRLEGGAGADRVDGGAGVDWVSYRGSNEGVSVDLRDNAVSGGHAGGDTITGFENVTGSAFRDVLIGNDEVNRLVGAGGADDLQGNGGNDVLEGGAGADTLDGGTGTDWASYAGSDTGVSVDFNNGASEKGHAQGDVFTSIENLRGSPYNDMLSGDDSVNAIDGEDGADELQGNGGNDVLKGGAGADRLDGGEGDDELAGDEGDDILVGGAGADRLDGGTGVDRASYSGSDAGVTVNLDAGTGAGGHARGDVVTAVENLTGSVYADTLAGDDAANRLEGEGGNDELRGNGGDDVLKGGAGDDVLDGGAGNDELFGGEGDDTLNGGADNDELYGNEGDDTLNGGAGADRVYAGAGADQVDGGSGSDWLIYRESEAGVTIDLTAGTAGGGYAEGDTITNVENIIGTAFADVLRGDGSANVLQGLDGDDELRGNGGDDVLDGGAGADRLDGGAGTDRVSYRDSDAGVTVYLAAGTNTGGHAQGDVLAGIENVTGSDHHDYLYGDGEDNSLEGRNGHDWLYGGAGADRLDGGDGSDWIRYWGSDAGVTVNLGEGTASGGHAEGDVIVSVENVIATQHADVLTGTDGNNYLDGQQGNDELRGGDGNDRLDGSAGADLLDGGGGIDTILYFSSDAGVTVNLAEGTGSGGQAAGDVITGVENITGSDHADSLTGDDNDNYLGGLDGDDDLRGNDGDDWLTGEGGADRLEGGPGADTLYGSNGFAADESIDTFVFATGHGDDQIQDFADNEDLIDLTAFTLTGFDDLTITSTPISVTIDLTEHGGGTIQLQNFDIANLDATDFLF